jgi:hypothetical protein
MLFGCTIYTGARSPAKQLLKGELLCPTPLDLSGTAEEANRWCARCQRVEVV